MNSIIILLIVTVCGDPTEVIGYLPDNGKVAYINVEDDPWHSVALKMVDTYPENIYELTKEVPTVCS